jgi:hypothetical protein
LSTLAWQLRSQECPYPSCNLLWPRVGCGLACGGPDDATYPISNRYAATMSMYLSAMSARSPWAPIVAYADPPWPVGVAGPMHPRCRDAALTRETDRLGCVLRGAVVTCLHSGWSTDRKSVGSKRRPSRKDRKGASLCPTLCPGEKLLEPINNRPWHGAGRWGRIGLLIPLAGHIRACRLTRQWFRSRFVSLHAFARALIRCMRDVCAVFQMSNRC